MKFKHLILSYFTLLAIVWSIVYSGPVLFQHQQKFNTEKLQSTSTQDVLLNAVYSNEDEFLLFNLFSNKTEETSEFNEFENEPEIKSFINQFINARSIILELVDVDYYVNNNTNFLFSSCSIPIKYCSLKIPF
ncbi:MAG: hypothetical protein KDD24_03930 [Flavobacteriales bacterium]|nr:hypothetical protein [Flavobacteriales bacterium]